MGACDSKDYISPDYLPTPTPTFTPDRVIKRRLRFGSFKKGENSARESSERDNKTPNLPSADVLKKNLENTSGRNVSLRNDKSWTNGGSLGDAKNSSTRKTAQQRRPTERITNGNAAVPLKDHNGRLKSETPRQNGTPSQRRGIPTGRTAGSTPTPTPVSNKPAPSNAPSEKDIERALLQRLAPQIKHNAVGFEALGVLVNYLTNTLDAFSTPHLKEDLQKTTGDLIKTKNELEEARSVHSQVEEARKQDKQCFEEDLQKLQIQAEEDRKAFIQQHEHNMEQLRLRSAKELDDLIKQHGVEVSALQLKLDTHADTVSRALREEYEGELDRVTRRHEDLLRAALEAARMETEREAASQAQEAARKEAELEGKFQALETEHAALKEQSRRLMDSMKSDKNAKLQAWANRCRELQDEVDSLRSVLELRCSELQEQRKLNDFHRRDAEQLPGALQKIATMSGRLEDLQLQLDRKGLCEIKLNKRNEALLETVQQEAKQKKLLSLQNEELQWKLKQNTEILTALANITGVSDLSSFCNSFLSNGCSSSATNSPQDAALANKRTCKGNSNTPPGSPTLKGVIEKSESVSWMIELDTADDVLSRLMRRSSRPASSSSNQSRPVPVPSPKRQLSVPLAQSSSATNILSPDCQPQPKHRSSQRNRSLSASADNEECAQDGNWSAMSPRLPSSTPNRKDIRLSVLDLSDVDDYSSSKSSSMSCSSEGSELGTKASGADRDVMNTSCGSNSELFLSSKQGTLPKEAAGEAMISEEMTEEDANGIASSCDGSSSEEDSNSSDGNPKKSSDIQISAMQKPFLTLPITDSAAQSANNTPMDSSWSEEMEILSSAEN